MWSITKQQSQAGRAVTFFLVFAAILGAAWLLASWAEQSRGLSFGPAFAVSSLIGCILGLASLVNIPEEIQKSHHASMQHKHTA